MNKYAEYSRVEYTMSEIEKFRGCTLKRAYATKRKAQGKKGKLFAYKCNACGQWHRASMTLHNRYERPYDCKW